MQRARRAASVVSRQGRAPQSTFFMTFPDAYGFLPMIALAAKAVTIPYGRFTSSK
jgi:hypothetical protein